MIVEKGNIPQGWTEMPRPPSTVYYDCYKCNKGHRFKSKIGNAHKQFKGIDVFMQLRVELTK